jgi:hypothetical protein
MGMRAYDARQGWPTFLFFFFLQLRRDGKILFFTEVFEPNNARRYKQDSFGFLEKRILHCYNSKSVFEKYDRTAR